MIIMLLLVVMAIGSFTLFNVSSRLSSCDKVVMNTPISLFETSIPIVKEDEIFKPYFDKELLQTNIKSYYDEQLSKYVNSYSLYFLYYSQTDDSYCTSEKCDAVEITINADIAFSYRYKRQLNYEIKKGSK